MAIMIRKAVLDLSEVEKLCAVDWPLKDKIMTACEDFEVCKPLLSAHMLAEQQARHFDCNSCA